MSTDLTIIGPPAGHVLELIPASHGGALVAWCEEVTADALYVCAPLDQSRRPVLLDAGERLDVVWRSYAELRALPALLDAVEPGDRPRWRLRTTGALGRGQRRDAVRAPLRIPVRVGPEPTPITGSTVDVSEGGLRCVLDRRAQEARAAAASLSDRPAPPRLGDVVRIAALFPDFTIACLAEVTRREDREDARVELSLRFIGLTEIQQDLVRRRVFTRLRDLRHRGLL